MPFTRLVLLLGLSILSFSFARSISEPNAREASGISFSIARVPLDSLASALQDHLFPKYRDGIFGDSKQAISAIHKEDPDLATKLVDLAKQDAVVRDHLRKRQNGNSTGQPTSISSTLTSSEESVTTTSTSETSSTPSLTSITTTSSLPGQSPSLQSSSFSPSSAMSVPSASQPSTFGSTTESASPTTVIEKSSIVITSTSTTESTSTSSVPQTTTSSSSISSSEGQRSLDTTLVSSGGSSKPIESSASGGSDASSSTAVSTDHELSTTSVVTTSTTPIGPTSTPIVSGSDASGTRTGVLVPVTVSSTLSDGSVVGQSTNAFVSTAPTSVVIPVTTSDGQGNPVVTSTTAPAIVITGTDSNGSPVTTTSPLASVEVANGGSIITSAPAVGASTTPEVTTSTDAQGNVVTVTITPGGGTVSELHYQTVTLPDGQVQTVTSFAIVGTSPVGVDAPTTSSSSSKKPGLASDAMTPSTFHAAAMAVLLGTIMGVFVML